MAKRPVTTHTISTSDPIGAARESLRLARMLCREAAAARPERDATRIALESAVAALSTELLDLSDAMEEDEIQLAYELDTQRCLPGLPQQVAA